MIVAIIGGYLFHWDWTGLSKKTLWDWLQLLVVPVMLAVGGIWFNQAQKSREEKIALDNQRDASLIAYLDLITEHLIESEEHSSLRSFEISSAVGPDSVSFPSLRLAQGSAGATRLRTILVLRSLDDNRKKIVLQILSETGLFASTIFEGADLSEIDLRDTDLPGARLREVNLHKAKFGQVNLHHADLSGANLQEANFWGAQLDGAGLDGANLKGATGITVEELEKKAFSLKGATMPDGSKHS